MLISEDRVLKTCKLGQGEKTCSFLSYALGEGWDCLKKSSLEPHINKMRADDAMVAKGDNCSGPPHFAMFEV